MWPLRGAHPWGGGRRTFSNTGEYSSSVSRVFNRLSEKLKGRSPEGGGDTTASLPRGGRTGGGPPHPDAITKQFEGAVSKMELSRMLGRDLSYCMNILSKLEHFRGHSFWERACNRLVKGHMLHRINTESYFIMANSLSRVDLLLGGDAQQRKGKKSERLAAGGGSPLCDSSPFGFVSFDGDVAVERGKSYHRVYSEIAFRFLLNLEAFHVDCISCVLNMFAKLNLREYNLLGYYLADYVLLAEFRRGEGKESPPQGGTHCQSNGKRPTKMSKFRSSSDGSERTTLLHVDGGSISKLVIILHSLAKLGVVHLEFLSLCCFFLRKHLMRLNSLDICNVMHAFAKLIPLCSGGKKQNRVGLLRRVRSEAFQAYLDTVLKCTQGYVPRYGSTAGVHNTYELLLRKDVEGKLKQFCSDFEGEVVKLTMQIGALLQREPVLGSLTALQVSSLSLSMAKLKLHFSGDSYGSSHAAFYAASYAIIRRAHHLWRDFSLQSIADFLFGVNEKNISDEQVTLLLCYQFVRLIHAKYCSSALMKRDSFSQNHLNVVRQNGERIYFFGRTHRRVHFLDAKECSLVVRIFQSLAKSEALGAVGAVEAVGAADADDSPGARFPYDVCAWGGMSGKLGGKLDSKLDDSSRGNSHDSFTVTSADQLVPPPWEKLNQYPSGANPTFSSFEESAHLIRWHTMRTLRHVIWQHWDLLPFESKCMLCYFSLHVLDFRFPMGGHTQLDGYPLGKTVPNSGDSFCLTCSGEMKVPKFPEGSILPQMGRSLFARLLFYVLESMDPNSLSEVTMRQIHFCILSFYLDVMGWTPEQHRGEARAATPPGDMPRSCCVTASEGTSTNESLGEMSPAKCIDEAFLCFSLGKLQKVNALLDLTRVRSCQQREMTLTSRTHVEVYNCLRRVVEDLNGSGERKRSVLHSSEVIVGPFVLDCVIEREEWERGITPSQHGAALA
ncbi:hypothetical protein PVMG_02503 [Plasmodium vivax Mauritania I]|uniref:Uncharacterized protein n=1 Tax=Plasmodium vivax Mauritania I TaxID=1035515 RepID=A0A0J9THK8_PLAVI|nr:hypothetical protein PVMG_02503 [Plasmodium vivax Mauritania I]